MQELLLESRSTRHEIKQMRGKFSNLENTINSVKDDLRKEVLLLGNDIATKHSEYDSRLANQERAIEESKKKLDRLPLSYSNYS